MRFGLHYANFTVDGGAAAMVPALAETARIADQGGVDQLTLMDHWFQMESLGGPEQPMLDGYTGLGYLAAITERVRLGLLVTGVTYRWPGLLAKTVTTLDVLSGGRAQLGIGAAWYEREHLGLGVPFPPMKERFERLEETLQIVRQMWSENDGPYDGTHFQLAETVCVPRPVQHDPPVVIGGSGERKTLRLVAQYADACNLFGLDPEVIAHKIEVLHRHCEDVGRDPADVAVTVIGGDPIDDVDGYLAQAEQLAGLGVQLMCAGPSGGDPVGWTTELVERVLPRLHEI